MYNSKPLANLEKAKKVTENYHETVQQIKL